MAAAVQAPEFDAPAARKSRRIRSTDHPQSTTAATSANNHPMVLHSNPFKGRPWTLGFASTGKDGDGWPRFVGSGGGDDGVTLVAGWGVERFNTGATGTLMLRDAAGTAGGGGVRRSGGRVGVAETR